CSGIDLALSASDSGGPWKNPQCRVGCSLFPGRPGMAVYYASKAFLLSFSQALSQELRSQGVAVTALCPGYTKTGFQARAGFGPNDNLAKFSKREFCGRCTSRLCWTDGRQKNYCAWVI
ncbi:MAG: SDR family NAD(P)-dependent oxidoreductase, partial [Alphaproteobacteria bacterium]|nr:SDR family NAD(P)-dependent oxidoreductase [Alphaproteobacteria bacterium]